MLSKILHTYRFIRQHPLGKRKTSAALFRWVRWQVLSRTRKGPIIVPFANDAVLAASSGMSGASGNIYCGLHEFPEMSLLLHFLRSEDLFLDIGANIGSYTVLAGKAIGAHCLACEPVPTTFEALTRNIAVNRIEGNVDAKRIAVGDAEGSILFSTDRDSRNSVVGQDYSGHTERVPCVTLDQLLPTTNGSMWKIDVEGYERQVLAGATAAIAQPQLRVIICENGSGGWISEFLQTRGFHLAAYDPFTRKLEPISDTGNNLNSIWVRDFDYVQERCRTAPPYRVCSFVI
jgi:FkbM family methyltransferase